LGALLGILFIIIIAVAVSGDDKKTTPVDSGSYTPPAATEAWPKSEETAFINQCQITATNTMGAERAVPYCDCMLQKIETKYSNYIEATAKLASMTQAELTAMAIDCIK
jgi:hypothetical protein